MAGNLESSIRLKVKPGIRLAVVFIVIHAGAVTGLIYTGLPVPVRGLTALLIVINLLDLFHVYIWQAAASSPVEIYLDYNDVWWLTYKSGKTCKVNLISGSYVHPLLIILRFKHEFKRPVIILTPDVINNDLLRRLRVRLRYRKNRPGDSRLRP